MEKVGLAGCGALGSIITRALIEGIEGYELVGIADINKPAFDVPLMSFKELAENCDIVIEALPPSEVPKIAREVLVRDKTLIMLSACAILLFPEIEEIRKTSNGRIRVPSGALSGLDAVTALSCAKITSAKIASTKPPKGLKGAPFVTLNNIDLDNLTEKKRIFEGNAFEAAKAFPANVNVAATLSLAGIGPEETRVEVWADPNAKGNTHEITVTGHGSTITSRIENMPDPSNPKSSMQAAYSVISLLKRRTAGIALG